MNGVESEVNVLPHKFDMVNMEDNTIREYCPIIPLGKSAVQRQMTPREINTLYICREDIRGNIDPVSVASTLHRQGRLTQSVYSSIMNMFRQDMDRECITEFFISHVPFSMNLEYFVQVLDECGYRKIATHLFLTYITGGITCVNKSTSGQRPAVHNFFRNLKRMVHDAQFQNPRLALRQLANRFVDQMQNETNPVRRQLLADKCIAIIGAEIDAIAITFDKRLREHDVFTQMKQLVSETSNTSVTDVVYLGRLANANSIAGNFHNSEDMLTEARCRAYNTGPCLELVNMLYIEVYVKLWEFEKYPSEELRKQLMMWGRIGLESLEHEDVDTKTLWRRMFILRMVFCLLGIGNRANVIENCPVDKDCLSQARNLLSDIDRTWYGIETRRKMFYFVAKARLGELTNSITECIENIKVARKLANDGHFEEIKFIAEYYEKVTQQIGNQLARQSLIERYQTRNFVLLKRETNDSTTCLEERCILAAADEHREFVLLKNATDIPFSVEESYEICEEFDSKKYFSLTNVSPCSNTKPLTYKPIACDEENNFVLFKSFKASIDPGQNLNTNNIQRSSVYNNQSHELPDSPTFTRNFVLLHTSHDGSVLPLFDDDMIPTCPTDNVPFMSLTSTEQTEALSNQLVLTDLHNRSHNFLLINSHDSDSVRREIPPNFCNHRLLSCVLPQRLESSTSIAEQVENIANNDPGTDIKETFWQHNHRLMSLKDDPPQFTHVGSTRHEQQYFQAREASVISGAWKTLEHVSSSQLTSNYIPSAAVRHRCIVNPHEGSTFIPAPSFDQRQPTLNQTVRAVVTPSDVNGRYVTIDPDHRLNIQFKESSVDTSDSKALEPTSNLIPADACYDLPRYYIVQPDEHTATAPMPGDRSEPSGCSEEDIFQILPNQPNSNMYGVYRHKNAVVDQENPEVQAWSFQSDEMFGD